MERSKASVVTKRFSGAALKAMMQEDSEELTEVTRISGDKGRWHTTVEVIFREEVSGKLYCTYFLEAATEHQEHEWPDDEDCVEVREVQKTVTAYEPV